MTRRRPFRAIVRLLRGSLAAASLACLAGAASLPAIAAGNPPASFEAPMLDPWVPPAAQPSTVSAPTEGAALRAQVAGKLERAFDAADVSRTGSLTRVQARAAGLGYVDRHFDAIDQRKAGAVTFDDVKRFLRARGARID